MSRAEENSHEEKTGREKVYDAIRFHLSSETPIKTRRDAVARRLAERPRGLTPARVTKPAPDLRTLLKAHLAGQSATVLEIADADGVPAAVAAYLRGQNLPQRVRSGTDAYLAALPWHTEPALDRELGRANADDAVGLSHATAAVAETGTLVLASGVDNPVTLNYLPETHIVVLEAKDIVGPYEDAFDRIRARFGDRLMPRTVNFISGPSRTGDIGGELVMGAHGPRRLCVVVVGG